MAYNDLIPEPPGLTFVDGKHWKAIDADHTRTNFADHQARILALETTPALPVGFAQLYQVHVMYTDAAIKAWPTTPLPILPAPGTGLRIIPIFFDFYLETSAGGYGNINQYAWIVARIGSTDYTGYVGNDPTELMTDVTDLLGSTSTDKHFILTPWQPLVLTWGTTSFVDGNAGVNLTNKAIELYMDNLGDGDLVGGNAANNLHGKMTYFMESD